MHSIEAHWEVAAGQEGSNLVKIEEALHEVSIGVCIVDHIDFKDRITHYEWSLLNYGEIDIGYCRDGQKLWDFSTEIVYRVSEGLRGGATVRRVEFDAKVFLNTSWVVRGCQQNSPHAFFCICVQASD